MCYPVDLKVPWRFETHWSKAVPGKIHGSGGHNKCNCLQDRANFHRSWAWQIVLIFKTATVNYRINYPVQQKVDGAIHVPRASNISKRGWHEFKRMFSNPEYNPRNMHKVHTLLCFVMVSSWLFSPISFGIIWLALGQLPWCCASKTPQRIWVNKSQESMKNNIKMIKQ